MVQPGHYAAKQILCSSRTIAWAHQSRFRVALDLVARHGGSALLDYGCGDATFLGMLLDRPHPSRMAGCEIGAALVADCRARFNGTSGVSFHTVDALRSREYGHAFDTLVCMEVLEHVVDVDALFAEFERLLIPGGRAIISVPVETGLSVVVKQSARRIAGWRGLGDYPGMTPYTAREMLASVFATARPHIDRPVHYDSERRPSHDHKGFNWMAFRARLSERFRLIETAASPLRFLSPHFNSQAWFVAATR